MTHGQLVGVLVVESRTPVAYTSDDEALLMVVATLVASAIETSRVQTGAPRAIGSSAEGNRPHPEGSCHPPGCATSRSMAASSSTGTT